MTFAQSISTVFRKYAEFRGTATRPEFWWWILFTTLVNAALSSLTVWNTALSSSTVWHAIHGVPPIGPNLTAFWGIAVLLPTLAVTVRRLRSAGHGWGNVFWILLPLAGLIVLIVLCAEPERVMTSPAAPVTAPDGGAHMTASKGGRDMARPVVHWEIGARDAMALRQFYSALFGWEITGGPEYGLVAAAGGGIGGGIMQTREGMPPYVTFYAGVDDLQGTLDRAAELGGKTLVPPTPIPGVGSFAMLSDPEGNMIGLMVSTGSA